jgi:hypothetical protein
MEGRVRLSLCAGSEHCHGIRGGPFVNAHNGTDFVRGSSGVGTAPTFLLKETSYHP